ncbi:hypothetical protein PR048_016331 [Dryococelus australis]|uniref:Uncharacterized protein n=1 Tax=Dryococelus australis TaxID=614101 RepID=A0ABQ9HJH0_9NEOP|nr:hypothetical protein PR048_016331 [Dryococelus australis]
MWKGSETDLTSMNPKENNYLDAKSMKMKEKVKRRKLECNGINRNSGTIFDCRKDIKLNIALFTIDKLVVELSCRISALRFGFLRQLSSMPLHDIRGCVRKAVEAYPNDVNSELI